MRAVLMFLLTVLLTTMGQWRAEAQFTTTTQIGAGAPGSMVTNGPGSFTVIGGGHDIWAGSDAFTFHYFARSGNFDLRARIESLQPNAPATKAGLMARETTAPNSRMAYCRVTPVGLTSNGQTGSNDVRFGYRTGTTSPAQGQHADPVTGFPAPAYPNAWVRLQRSGSSISAYSSGNGSTWTLLGTQNTTTWGSVPISSNLLLGLAVSRGSNGASATARAEIRHYANVLSDPVTITRQPLGQTVTAGQTATFSVDVAGGYDAFTAQWRASGTNISGATGGGYTTGPTTAANNGTAYSVVISNVFNGSTVTSAVAVLTVNVPPSITVQPQSRTHCPNTSASFNVTATGTSPLSYQWRFNGTNIAGATGSSHTIGSVQASNAGNYSVVVTNVAGSTTSSNAALTVNTPTTANGPNPATTCQGTAASFSTSAAGDGPFSYAWRLDGGPTGTNGPNLSATTSTLSVGNHAVAVIVTGACGSVSNSAMLTINPNTSATPLTSLTRRAGESATFSTMALGTGPFTVLWRKDGVLLSGQTNNALTISSVTTSDAGTYSVHVTGGCGSVSNSATLTVQELDFGDAPYPFYPTLLANNGARHVIVPGFQLGARVDAEPDGQPNATATGDDLPAPDDEDGVNFTSPLILGRMATLNVTASANGFLHAWVDFNVSRNWEAAEQIFFSRQVVAGANPLSFLVPTNAVPTNTFARFRFTRSTVPLSFDGPAADGEVEDYQVTLEVPPPPPPCERSNKGTNFWLTFPGNYAPDPANPVQLSLGIVGDPGTIVRVDIPGLPTPFSTNVTIPADMKTNIALPREAELGSANDVVTNKGIHVTASRPVAVFGLNHVPQTSDGYLGLPSDVLGREYFVLGYRNVHSGVPSLNGTQFAIVACENDTIVTNDLPFNTGARLAHTPYTVPLQQGDVYQLRDTNGTPHDLTGARITANKPIAVFGSHRCADINSSRLFFCDYLVEQLLPTEYAGTEFVTRPLTSLEGKGDTFRFLALADDTRISVNGDAVTNLDQRGQFSAMLIAGAARITANHPILVAQYANSSDYYGVTQADPLMTIVPSTDLFLSRYMICVPEGFENFINVIVPDGAEGTVQLDGLRIPILGQLAGGA